MAMSDLRVGRNDPCPCGSGKKFKKCCLLRQANGPPPTNGTGLRPQSGSQFSRGPTAPGSPTFWSHPPGQPDAPPPAGGEWVEYVFVKDKGWTHESQLKPGDQYRLKGGGWATVEPERVIGTTQEHPFYVRGEGWTPLAEIQPGDWIRTDNDWVQVTKIEDTGRYETVYNLRVQDYHTYFVGARDWGFAVWAHNAGWDGCGSVGKQLSDKELLDKLKQPGKHNVTVGTKTEALDLARKAVPTGTHLPDEVAGQAYGSTKGIKSWFRVEPAEPAVGNDLPHVKFADWTGGKKRTGGRHGHIFFLSDS
jgi:hypothetical protein